MIFMPECDKNEVETHKTTSSTIQVHPLTLTPTRLWKQLRTVYRVEKWKPLFPYPPIRKDCVRFVCIGDTHMRHEERNTDLSSVIPPGDVLLHVGDFTMDGSMGEVYSFNQHYGSLPHKVKLLIAGNHDSCLDAMWKHTSFWGESVMNSQETLQKSRDLLSNFTYLQDAMVEVYGIKIYGAPWVPVCHSDAFTLQRGMPLLRRWNLIPEDTDILMTHGPPVGYGDTLDNGRNVGCVELLNTVRNRVRPKYHVYGHIHEGYGMYTDGQTVFINAAMCTKGYRPVQAPIIFDFPLPKGHSKNELVDLSVNESVLQLTPDEPEERNEVTEGKTAEVRLDTTAEEVRLDTMATEIRKDTYNHRRSKTGYHGNRSETGYQGSRSETGYQGNRSETGYHGNRSETGYHGNRSETGYQGSRSETGYHGSRSETGYHGNRSETGYHGNRNQKGYL